MDFDLTDEQKMIREMSRDFAEEVIAPRAEEMERTGEYPYDIIAKMGELGMLGIPFPEKYGGSGGDWVGLHLCIEEISRGDSGLGGLVDVTTTVVGQELLAFGTEEQKQKWLIPLAKGEIIGAFALTEPDSGSDAGALRTMAVLKGDEYILNGTKQFISNIGLDNSPFVLVAALAEKPKDGRKIISTFIVPKDSPGFTLGKRYDKMSGHGIATNEVILEDCRISKDNLLGDPNRGFAQHLAMLETGLGQADTHGRDTDPACFQ
ncbi:MAG: acyl-CoA dehydrogenase family protein, partial [Thermodesulfobacteriota bacterium]|nr:acyl-CoA dehydrogenase family protein [Thermodesulfobacteriota bacterium]